MGDNWAKIHFDRRNIESYISEFDLSSREYAAAERMNAKNMFLLFL